MHRLRKPYLVFLGDVALRSDAKTGFGLRDWCPEDVIGECALAAAQVSLDLPKMTPAEAAAAGAGSIVIGVAPVGGQLPQGSTRAAVDLPPARSSSGLRRWEVNCRTGGSLRWWRR
jgi:hypothetical protein